MSEPVLPVQSKTTLIKASVFATLLALIALVFIILPAEYNIDPTGVGKALGLNQLANPEQQSKPVADEQLNPSSNLNPTKEDANNDKVIIEVPAGKGLEYKFKMNKYANMDYQWYTDQGQAIYFDFHGEPEGDTTGYFKSYTISTSNQVNGSLTAPFPGVHGWYWKNNSSEAIIISLEIKGDYELVGFIQ